LCPASQHLEYTGGAGLRIRRPNTTRFTRAWIMALAHMQQGSSVT
jgi:hypothetical protein